MVAPCTPVTAAWIMGWGAVIVVALAVVRVAVGAVMAVGEPGVTLVASEQRGMPTAAGTCRATDV